MVYAYRLSDGQFLRGYPQEPPYDPATEGVQTYRDDQRPDMRTERYDGAAQTKKRPATVQEIAAYDAARASEKESGEFDGQKMLKAVAIWAAGKLGVAPATAKQEILTIYRGL